MCFQGALTAQLLISAAAGCPCLGPLRQTSELIARLGSSFQIGVPHPAEPAARRRRRRGTAQHPSSAPFSDRLLLGDSFWETGTEQHREKLCGEGRLASRDALSLFAEGENLVFSLRNPLPQALLFEMTLSGFARSRSVLRAFCCSQCFAATVSWEML